MYFVYFVHVRVIMSNVADMYDGVEYNRLFGYTYHLRSYLIFWALTFFINIWSFWDTVYIYKTFTEDFEICYKLFPNHFLLTLTCKMSF